MSHQIDIFQVVSPEKANIIVNETFKILNGQFLEKFSQRSGRGTWCTNV